MALARREARGAEGQTHAKLAVAHRRVPLVSSASLALSGVAANIEAGLLIRGGTAPQRAAEHIAELRARGVLAPAVQGEFMTEHASVTRRGWVSRWWGARARR